MRIFIERFLLAILAPLALLLAVTNPMGFDWPLRIIGITVIVVLAGIAAHIAGWEEWRWERLRGMWWLWSIFGLSGGVALGVLGKTTTNPGDNAWDDSVKLERIYNRTFVNESVSLDGRHFINPIFDNVTFFFQGTAPVFMENPTYILHNGKMVSRLASRNKVVTMTMKIYDNLSKAAGFPSQILNLGPEAPFDVPKIEHDR